MSRPMFRSLSRPLARFLLPTWMSRSPLTSAALSGAVAGKKKVSIPETRPSLEALEERLTPQDMLGVLRSGISVLGVTLVGGQFITPLHALLSGWDDGRAALPQAVPNASVSVAVPPELPELAPGQLAALNSFGNTFSPAQGGAAISAISDQAASIQPAAQAQQGNSLAGDWLQSIGGSTASQASLSGVSTNVNAAGTNGGGGGGAASIGPSAALNATQPVPALPTGSANVPSANAAALMTQSTGARGAPSSVQSTTVVQSAPARVTVGGTSQASASPVVSKPVMTALTNADSNALLQSTVSQTPLSFELNAGQANNSSVLALSQGPGYGFWLTNSSMVFSLMQSGSQTGQQAGDEVFALQMEGANAVAKIVPGQQMGGVSNYFIGSDSSKWLTDLAQYSSLTYQGVYPGIDLVLHSQSVGSQEFEYDYVLQPGANVSEIQLSVQGVQGLSVDAQGRLVLSTPGGDVMMGSPVLYQISDGRQQNVAGSYVLGPNDTLGFKVTGSYDPSEPLVIDPTVDYSTYFGGSLGDGAFAIAVDGDDNSYITGMTFSSNFPTSAYGYQTSISGTSDIFVTKLNADDTAVDYSTYIGGTVKPGGDDPANQCARAIALNSDGDAVIAGWTEATDYPTSGSAYSGFVYLPGDTSGLIPQGVVTELNCDGDGLEFSTYLGGSFDTASGVAIDSSGVYVTGVVGEDLDTSAFPITGGAFQPDSSVNDPSAYYESTSAFVMKFNSSGTSLIYSSFLSGSTSGSNTGMIDGTWTGSGYLYGSGNYGTVSPEGGIAIDSSGDAYVTGTTSSTDFPVTGSAYQTSLAGSSDAFVSVVNPDGTALLYSTYLGGADGDTAGHGIALDSCDNVYVTGETTSSSFPTASAYQGSIGGGSDAFVTKLNSCLSSLSYSTYLGGEDDDEGFAIAVDCDGNATVTGMTDNGLFPTNDAFQSTAYGPLAGFVAQYTSSGSQNYASYIGGTSSFTDFLGSTAGYGVAVDSDGKEYVAGATSTQTLYDVSGGYQSSNAGAPYFDAFVMKVTP